LFLSIFCSFSNTLFRNIRDYWEINHSLFGTDSWPARNKSFIDDVDDDADDDKMITESKKMLGKYGLVVIMQV
jgi:hypothetical protein